MASSALGSQSIALLQLPSGTLIDFAGTIEPSGWLLCDGRELLKTSPTYASLFAAIGVAYGETNGSGGAGTTHFRLPDFRGRFARYNDNMGTAQGAAGQDSGRVHGSTQADAMQGHRHSKTETNHSHGMSTGIQPTSAEATGHGTTNTGPTFINRVVVTGAGTISASGSTSNLTVTDPVIDTTPGNSNPRTAIETRPKNLACNKLIKI